MSASRTPFADRNPVVTTLSLSAMFPAVRENNDSFFCPGSGGMGMEKGLIKPFFHYMIYVL